MNLFLQLALIWLGLGLGFGLVMKTQLGEKWRFLALLLSILPLLVHLAYVCLRLFPLTKVSAQLYAGSSVLLAIAVFWVGWKSLERRGKSLALLPLVLALLYTFGPLTWLASSEMTLNLRFSAISSLIFYVTSLFMSAMLLAFSLNLPSFPKRSEALKE